MKKQAVTKQSQMMGTLYVHHKTISGFLQEIRQSAGGFMRVQPLEREIVGHRVWGVLLTARLGDEIHIAWVNVREARLSTPALHEQAVAAQAAIVQHVLHLAAQAGLEVRDGWYAVVPEILLYREPATLEDGAAVPDLAVTSPSSWSEQEGN